MPHGHGTKALLFDQLTERSEFLIGTPQVPILLDEDGVKASVHKELTALLNTRTSFSNEAIEGMLGVVEDERLLSGIEGMMGLPELRDAFAEGAVGVSDFTQVCARTIRLYEPRLRNPSVRVSAFDAQRQRLNLIVEGELVVGTVRENVAFSVLVNSENDPEEA